MGPVCIFNADDPEKHETDSEQNECGNQIKGFVFELEFAFARRRLNGEERGSVPTNSSRPPLDFPSSQAIGIDLDFGRPSGLVMKLNTARRVRLEPGVSLAL